MSEYDQQWIDRVLKQAQAQPVVYFVGWDEGPIKIGHAINLRHRLHQIQVHCPYPLRVWAIRHGPNEMEREYHRRFASLRIRGEWFERAYPVLHEIERLQRWNGKGWKVPEHVRGRPAVVVD